MATSSPIRPLAPTAIEVSRHLEMGEDALALLSDQQTPGEFLTRLFQRSLFDEAIRFAAHALPPRHAIWWGALCAWSGDRPTPNAPLKLTYDAIVQWVQQPGESQRRKAEEMAAGAAASRPAGLLAQAVFYSGGSISHPGLPAVVPDPQLVAQAVAGAVLLSANRPPAAEASTRKRQFVVWAGLVASGRLDWESADALLGQLTTA